MKSKKDNKLLKAFKIAMTFVTISLSAIGGVSLFALNIYCNDNSEQESYVEILEELLDDVISKMSNQNASENKTITEVKEKTIISKEKVETSKKKSEGQVKKVANSSKNKNDNKKNPKIVWNSKDSRSESKDGSFTQTGNEADSQQPNQADSGNTQTENEADSQQQSEADSGNTQTGNEADSQQPNQADSGNTQTMRVDSQGQLVFLSSDTVKSGTVTMYCNPNIDTGEQVDENIEEPQEIEEEGDTYNIEDIVNYTNEENNTIVYININPGVYNITFDTSAELNVYLVNDIDDFIQNQYYDEIQEDYQENPEDAYLDEVETVSFVNDESVYCEDIYPEFTFFPTIYFNSDGDIDGNLEILDEDQNILESFNISELDGTNQKECGIELLEGNRYTVRINACQNETGEERVYYYKIFDLVE